ncbi:hypothetical protein EVAR_54151_1 [Eumeta japonica]|uniref:Uncharacterized protein n=1 Tax=Eumeta variegata TaxID=151549 RepID=A0A4C1Y1D5_EUMVA|nr:hypothetical protein EVAR_54151_1 [Eumeta japonica]
MPRRLPTRTHLPAPAPAYCRIRGPIYTSTPLRGRKPLLVSTRLAIFNNDDVRVDESNRFREVGHPRSIRRREHRCNFGAAKTRRSRRRTDATVESDPKFTMDCHLQTLAANDCRAIVKTPYAPVELWSKHADDTVHAGSRWRPAITAGPNKSRLTSMPEARIP